MKECYKNGEVFVEGLANYVWNRLDSAYATLWTRRFTLLYPRCHYHIQHSPNYRPRNDTKFDKCQNMKFRLLTNQLYLAMTVKSQFNTRKYYVTNSNIVISYYNPVSLEFKKHPLSLDPTPHQKPPQSLNSATPFLKPRHSNPTAQWS